MIETIEETKRIFIEEKELYINPKIALIISIARLNGFSNIIYDFFKEVNYNEDDLIITKDGDFINNENFKLMFKNYFPNIWNCYHNLKECCGVKKSLYQKLLNNNWQLITQDNEINNIKFITNLIYTTEHNMKMINKGEKEKMPIIREQVKDINDDEINIIIDDLIEEGLEIEAELKFKVGDILSFKHHKIIRENFMNKMVLFSNDPTKPTENWIKRSLISILPHKFKNGKICKKMFLSNNSRKRYQYIQLCEESFMGIENNINKEVELVLGAILDYTNYEQTKQFFQEIVEVFDPQENIWVKRLLYGIFNPYPENTKRKKTIKKIFRTKIDNKTFFHNRIKLCKESFNTINSYDEYKYFDIRNKDEAKPLLNLNLTETSFDKFSWKKEDIYKIKNFDGIEHYQNRTTITYAPEREVFCNNSYKDKYVPFIRVKKQIYNDIINEYIYPFKASTFSLNTVISSYNYKRHDINKFVGKYVHFVISKKFDKYKKRILKEIKIKNDIPIFYADDISSKEIIIRQFSFENVKEENIKKENKMEEKSVEIKEEIKVEKFIPKYYSGLDVDKEEVKNLLTCEVEFSDNLETWKKSTLNIIKKHRYYDINNFGWIYIRTVEKKEYYDIPATTLPKPIINVNEIKGDFYKLNIPGKSYSKNGWHTADTEIGVLDDLLFHEESDAQKWVDWMKSWKIK